MIFKNIDELTSIETIQIIERLYVTSFPEYERLDFRYILNKSSSKDVDLYAIYDNINFVGFILLLTASNVKLIYYFAIVPQARAKGYGSSVVKEIQTMFDKHTISLMIESVKVDSSNPLERMKRKDFYLKNGFFQTDYIMKDSSGIYDILSTEGEVDVDITKNIFDKFSDAVGEISVEQLL